MNFTPEELIMIIQGLSLRISLLINLDKDPNKEHELINRLKDESVLQKDEHAQTQL